MVRNYTTSLTQCNVSLFIKHGSNGYVKLWDSRTLLRQRHIATAPYCHNTILRQILSHGPRPTSLIPIRLLIPYQYPKAYANPKTNLNLNKDLSQYSAFTVKGIIV